jgi:hypothetical protein
MKFRDGFKVTNQLRVKFKIALLLVGVKICLRVVGQKICIKGKIEGK